MQCLPRSVSLLQMFDRSTCSVVSANSEDTGVFVHVYSCGLLRSEPRSIAEPMASLVKEHGHRLLGVDVADGLRDERGDIQLHNLLVSDAALGQRRRVDDHDLLEGRVLDPLAGLAVEESVGGKGVDIAGAVVDEVLRGLAERAGCVDHVVDDDAVGSLDRADEVHAVDLVGLDALLDDHGEARVGQAVLADEPLAELLGARDAAGVWRDDDGVDELVGAEVGDADESAVEVVDWHARAEEALDLSAVEVDGDDTVDAHGLEQARDVGGRDGHARGHLAVLARVAVVGDDGGDAARRGAAHGTDHEQELHEVLVHGHARGLHDVHVLAAHVLVHHDVHLAVREALDRDLAQLHAHELGHVARQLRVGVPAEDLEPVQLGLLGRDRRPRQRRRVLLRLRLRLRAQQRSARERAAQRRRGREAPAGGATSQLPEHDGAVGEVDLEVMAAQPRTAGRNSRPHIRYTVPAPQECCQRGRTPHGHFAHSSFCVLESHGGHARAARGQLRLVHVQHLPGALAGSWQELLEGLTRRDASIHQYMAQLGAEVEVRRNDQITLDEIREMNPDRIMISPGPGYPKDAGVSCDVIREFAGKIPIAGVCLGAKRLELHLIDSLLTLRYLSQATRPCSRCLAARWTTQARSCTASSRSW